MAIGTVITYVRVSTQARPVRIRHRSATADAATVRDCREVELGREFV
jgi:hypothetical protein